MSSLSDFFGRKSNVAPVVTADKAPIAERAPTLTPGRGPNGDDRPAETWADIGSRIGSDNEALRNLLVDTGRQVGALDDLKDTFSKLVDPITKTLRALEQEKSENVSLRGTLADVRSTYEGLRLEYNELGRRSADNETEIERLRHELDLSQQAAKSAESSKIELNDELSTVRNKLGEFERQLGLESASVRTLTDENRALAERGSTADKRILELEGENALAKERLVLLENEKRSLQNSLEQMVADNSRLSRRINDSENSLTALRARLEQVETTLAATENERNKLTAAVDETNERRQSETNTLTMRLEAMQSRAAAAEKLLGEVRQNLIARTEENRVSERKVVEATIGRQSIEKKLEQLLTSLQGQERQIRDLEGSRATLVERSGALTKTVKSRETALARAEEKIQALGDQIKKLETDTETNRVKTEKRIEELNASLQREKLERAVTEGALEATRKNYAELQRELAAERSGRREEIRPEAIAEAAMKPSDKAKPADKTRPADKPKSDDGKPGANAVEPIIPS